MTKSSLSVGKLNPETLRQLVFNRLGASDARIILGPNIGEDATVIDFKDKALVVHSDPITGAIENIGWLSVNVCTNDIAARGVRPLWILTVLLLPENVNSAQVKHITSQIDEAARELNIAVIGGHTEVTVGIKRPIIVATAIGETKKDSFVRTGGAKVGDSVIVTKGAAIEGTAILSHELSKTLQKKVDKKLIASARRFIKMTSVVKDALTAVKAGGVHAMHDATEGGIAAGLQEVAWASNVGIVAHEEKIPLCEETRLICKALSIDPLKTVSSGALIISALPKKAKKIVAALQKAHIQASIIGKIVDKREACYVLRSDRTKLNLSKPVKEELWRVLPDFSKH